MTTTIVLADDHVMVREGLRALLEREADVKIIGEASNGREAITLVEQLMPHIAVVDIAMPGLNGIEATRRISAAGETKVIALSSYTDKRYVLAMLEAGASGFVVKTAAGDELLRAVEAVRHGRKYLGQEIAGVVVDGYLTDEPDSPHGAESLGGREREVLQLVAEGRTSAEIAMALDISPHTVDTHRRNLMRKLGLHSIAELTKFAVREGLTSL